MLGEEYFEKCLRSGWDCGFREEAVDDWPDIGWLVDVEVGEQCAEVVGIAGSLCGQDFHGHELFRGCCHDLEVGVVEDALAFAWCAEDVYGGLVI